MVIEKLESCPELNPNVPVKVTTAGNVIEIQYMDFRNTKQTIQMLAGGNEYVDLSTGEVKEVVHHETRADQKKSLMRTFKTLRGVINANVTDVSKVRWITLTYAENMTDTKRLYDDFRKFNMRFQYYIQKLGYDKAEYITVAEPQGRGAWHMHLLYIFDKTAPYLHNDTVFNPLWGHGITKIKQLKDVDNVGAYLTAYLGDLDVEDFAKNANHCMYKASEFFGGNVIGTGGIKEVEVEDENGRKMTKAYIKGGRLPLYPANFNMFRCSKGVKRPTEEMISGYQANKKVSAGTLTFEKTFRLTNEETDFKSLINTKYYNMAKCVKSS